jgi:hypothetical protein
MPLHAILASGKSFQWGENQKNDLNDLKNNINKALVLALLNLQNPFNVEADTSEYAMGAILM